MDFKCYQTPESYRELLQLQGMLALPSPSKTIRVAVSDRLKQEQLNKEEER